MAGRRCQSLRITVVPQGRAHVGAERLSHELRVPLPLVCKAKSRANSAADLNSAGTLFNTAPCKGVQLLQNWKKDHRQDFLSEMATNQLHGI